MPRTTTHELRLNRIGGADTPAASHRDHFERCERLRHELGLTTRGLLVALFLLEHDEHTIGLHQLGRRGSTNQALGVRGYSRVFERHVRHGDKPGKRTTTLSLTAEARQIIEAALCRSSSPDHAETPHEGE